MHRSHYHVFYNSTLASVVMEWQGLAPSSAFREGTEQMLIQLIEHRAHKVLADLTHMQLISLQDREWLQRDFLPRVFEAGLQTIAFVRSTDYYNQLSVGTVVYEIQPNQLNVNYFYDRREAEAWLCSH